MSLKYLSIALTALLLLGGCGDSEQKADEEMNSLVAKNVYNLKDLQGVEYKVTKTGNNFDVKGLENKIVIFDIFATWCPPCKAAAPNLTAMQKRYKDDLKIIGVLIEEDKDNAYVQKFKDKYGAKYSISNTPDNQKLSRAIAGAIGVGQGFPIPLMVLYYNGNYVNHYVGSIPEEMVESDIMMTLKKNEK